LTIPSTSMSPKDIILAACRLFEAMRGDEAVDRYFSPDYIEHNPTIVGGGIEGFRQLLRDEGFTTGVNRRGLSFHIHHVVAEGELVFVHQHVTEPGKPPLIIMDLYRVHDGRIVEHWDVMQTVPDSAANDRHAMV